MIEPPFSHDEPARLAALQGLGLLDTPLEERFERITRIAKTVFRAEIAAISLVEDDRQWFKSIQGLCATETSRKVSFCAHAIHKDDLLIVPDARVDPRFSGNPLVLGPPHIVFYAGRPLLADDGSRVGALCVIDSQPHHPTADELQALRDLGAIAEGQMRAAMQRGANEELFAEVAALRHRSRVDALTRVWNRASALEALDRSILTARREGSGVGVMMVDLDHFKPVNDTHGHVVGDEVLRVVAKRMLGAIREVDALGRYGGEEFIVALAPGATPKCARAVAERIRTAVSESPIDAEGVTLSVTTSVGVAVCSDVESCTPDDLIVAADDALYRAKEHGRDRVEITVLGESDSGSQAAA